MYHVLIVTVCPLCLLKASKLCQRMCLAQANKEAKVAQREEEEEEEEEEDVMRNR